MQKLNLKPTHKPVLGYYDALGQFDNLGISHETAVRSAFQSLLESCCRQFSWTLVPEWEIKRPKQRSVRVDGAMVDAFRLAHGYWEAKDERDDLQKEVKKKFAVGYPKDNIVFQAPERAILYQNGRQILDEDGGNRKENITDWALEEFRSRYEDESITKWDIFHYVYALLHHPLYRERYAANLKRELPRIPFAPDFHPFAQAGRRLAALHVEYENQPEYPLEMIEAQDAPLDWRVEKMRLSKDKTQIVYNDFLTLSGIPAETFDYRLGNRSALEWVIDRYRIKTDKRSGITNDPNRADDPQYIVRLIGQVITVSLETSEIVRALPDLGIETEDDSE